MNNNQQSLGEAPNDYASLADVGIDWLTFTTKTGHETASMLEVADGLAVELMAQRGHTSKSGSLLGYRGYAVGQLYYGEREDGGIARASGGTARYLFEALTQGGCHGNASRVDIQCTVKFASDREDYGRETAYQVAASTTRQKNGRPASVVLHRGFGGGDTCTIGKRSSSRVLRLYDKSREQDNEVEPNLWRFEVEYKAELAKRMFSLLRSTNEAEALVRDMVAREFIEQGVLVPWEPEAQAERLKTATDKTTIEKQLLWLKKQVAPTMRRLERLGYGSEAHDALYPPSTEDSV